MARPDVHAEITAGIVEQLRQGIRPWTRPWDDGEKAAPGGVGLPLRDNGQAYGGINVVVLWAAAHAHGYEAPTWMTFNQAKKHGGSVKKGETGQTVVYAKTYPKRTTDPDTGLAKQETVGFLKRYRVFNVEQIDGLGERWYRSHLEIHPINPDRRSERLEAFFAALEIDVRTGGTEAYYVLADDYVQMPAFELFHDREAYYTTLAHESIHWTRHASRLNRTFRGSYQVPYAKEELVAEIGSAFLAAELGVAPAVREDHADYIGAWLRVLEDDNKAIFRAAGHATKAVTWLTQRARAMGFDLHAGIDAAEGQVREVKETAPGLPLEEDPSPSWPVRGVAPGAVQGELFLSTRPLASLYGARDARAFVRAAIAFLGREERSDPGNPLEEAQALRQAAGRLDLEDPTVCRAVEGAVIRSRANGSAAAAGRLPRTAGDFVALVQGEAEELMAEQRMAQTMKVRRGGQRY
ncbi:MAG: zincin-like metallopeptidase domain-containing protein [bacterium]|nr:zincin-like metallopeptidase domain-containing protein [bacterium]